MRLTRLIHCALPLALAATAAIAGAQGKGKGGGDDKEKGKGKSGVSRGSDKNDKGRGYGVAQKDDDKDRGRGNAFGNRGKDKDKDKDDRARVVISSGGNVSFREFVTSDRKGRRLAGLAVASAARRGSDKDFLITPVGDRVQVLNRDGIVLVDFEDDRELGNWSVVTEPFRDKRGAPSFCRSGAGHPVWGRQWCVDKGFGLGSDNDLRWGRAVSVQDVILRPRNTTGDLTRDVLASVLGDVVFNRLAAHALTLGLAEPLMGRWAVEPSGRRVLLVNSGTVPVAEVVDSNKDDRADVLLVALKPW